MKQRVLVVGVVLCALAAGLGWTGHLRARASEARARQEEAVAARAVETAAAERDRAIATFQRRAAADPYSAIDLSWLASLYLRRARETGSTADYVSAEKAARSSLALRVAHNTATYQTLAASLVAQHRFAEARDAARRLVESDPEDPSFLAMLGEIEMELGDYDAAKPVFEALGAAKPRLSVLPRLARWHEVSGRMPEARKLLYRARDEAVGRADLPAEQVAWYHFRVGDLELRDGELEPAERAFRAGLAVNPGDYRLLAALARLEAARHDWEEAARYGEEAIAAVLDPATLGVVSDAYAALGDSVRARELVKVMELSAFHEDEPLHRPWGLFFLDHGLHVGRVAAEAAEEVRGRRDVYGYDLLAWALHKQGKHAEARAAMRRALRMGTQDATLSFHAGMIERALGDRRAAREHLERALELNPHFHPTQPDQARRVLESL